MPYGHGKRVVIALAISLESGLGFAAVSCPERVCVKFFDHAVPPYFNGMTRNSKTTGMTEASTRGRTG